MDYPPEPYRDHGNLSQRVRLLVDVVEGDRETLAELIWWKAESLETGSCVMIFEDGMLRKKTTRRMSL